MAERIIPNRKSRNVVIGERLRAAVSPKLAAASPLLAKLLAELTDLYVGTAVRDANAREGKAALLRRAAGGKLLWELAQLGRFGATDRAYQESGGYQLEKGARAPDLSVSLLAVAISEYRKRQSAANAEAELKAQPPTARMFRNTLRTRYYADQATSNPRSSTMYTSVPTTPTATSSQRSGCGCGCGGAQAAPNPTTTTGSPCDCPACTAAAPPPTTKTYDDCTPWKVSCETQDRLRECIKVALCDFLRCVDGELTQRERVSYSTELAGEKPVAGVDEAATTGGFGDALLGCLVHLGESLVHCLPEALCPPEPTCGTSAVAPLPCDYAVETKR